jgi:hypothetical protein
MARGQVFALYVPRNLSACIKRRDPGLGRHSSLKPMMKRDRPMARYLSLALALAMFLVAATLIFAVSPGAITID